MEQLIAVQGMNKVFETPGGSFQVLKDIDFSLNKGEMTALMGPSGAGKSTLLHILGTLDRPSSGEVMYSGKNVFGLNNDQLSEFRNRTVGFVFQFHHLMPEFNAMENAMMPALILGLSNKEARGKAEHLLEAVGLSERLRHKPGQLSGGEQQRVAVARALMLDPEVVLADEPTGNLDTKTGDDLLALLLELNKTGTSFIIVTHNESLAAQCGSTVRMKDGRII
jgi:lipoprotein-releasing system ATP-binding protein